MVSTSGVKTGMIVCPGPSYLFSDVILDLPIGVHDFVPHVLAIESFFVSDGQLVGEIVQHGAVELTLRDR